MEQDILDRIKTYIRSYIQRYNILCSQTTRKPSNSLYLEPILACNISPKKDVTGIFYFTGRLEIPWAIGSHRANAAFLRAYGRSWSRGGARKRNIR
jgi:hypothetical protein